MNQTENSFAAKIESAKRHIHKPRFHGPPKLHVTIDTEEEFDWSAPFSRTAVSARNSQHQFRAQDIFRQLGVKPTYVVDQAILDDDWSLNYYKGLHAAGEAEIGVHLHPWLTPPFDEELTPYNSFHGNLPRDLEQAKIATITELFNKKMGFAPNVFKAGRYGLGPNSYEILKRFGYSLDLSPVANTSFKAEGGPDFGEFPDQPFWSDESFRLLSVPLSKPIMGILKYEFGPLNSWRVPFTGAFFDHKLVKKFKLPAILARLHLAERIPLTPEGVPLERLEKAITFNLKQSVPISSYAYHSSSLMVGGSPYAQTQTDVDHFVEKLAKSLTLFKAGGGEFISAQDLYAIAKTAPLYGYVMDRL